MRPPCCHSLSERRSALFAIRPDHCQALPKPTIMLSCTLNARPALCQHPRAGQRPRVVCMSQRDEGFRPRYMAVPGGLGGPLGVASFCLGQYQVTPDLLRAWHAPRHCHRLVLTAAGASSRRSTRRRRRGRAPPARCEQRACCLLVLPACATNRLSCEHQVAWTQFVPLPSPPPHGSRTRRRCALGFLPSCQLYHKCDSHPRWPPTIGQPSLPPPRAGPARRRGGGPLPGGAA